MSPTSRVASLPALVVAGALLSLLGCDCGDPRVRPAFDAGCVAETCDGFDQDCDGVVDNGLPAIRCGVGACARELPSCVGGLEQQCEPLTPSNETCNGMDDDCDGAVDEGLAELSCGVGACARTVTACAEGVAQTCEPGAPLDESCNGLDDDCDGETDENLAPLSCGVGACVRTAVACSAGTPGQCEPGTPEAERCDGLDNDCDGETDEGFPMITCGVGACARTVAACVAGEGQRCDPGLPTAETCDGVDNDCDGETDEALPALSCGVGDCARTVAACVNGAPQLCTEGAPAAETCDGRDNDCDGAIDDALPALTCGVGACARTAAACINGTPQVCTQGTPSAETCDGVDNDCDGSTDEALPALSCGVGECARTVAACVNATPQTCVEGAPATETCDGRDNDCDGAIDDAIPALTCGIGECARTVTACVGGLTQTCTQGAPSAETCDGRDNDCDGALDEDLPALSCGVGECARTVSACAGGMPQTCTSGTPSAETCDGRDNDCDTLIDDALAPLTCGIGECARSVTACSGGVPQTCTAGTPVTEVCDGRDNDCDGAADEDGLCNPPVVMCGGSLSTIIGVPVTLTASAADSDGTIVSQAWQVTQRPAGSTALPASPAQPSTSFTPDAAGTYVLTFCARDNAGTTVCCSTTLSTAACAFPPAPPVSTACGQSWDGRPIVQFPPVPSGLVYQLTLPGDSLVRAQASVGHNYLRPAARLAAGGPMPGLGTTLEVRACRAADLACCSTPSTLTVDVVESCTTPVAPTTSNLVISEYVVAGEPGTCPSLTSCQSGEAVELTNLSNCPITLSGSHFAYRNSSSTPSSYRWMNFGPAEVVPPRGVYVAIRNLADTTLCSASLLTVPQSAGLYGLRLSTLTMQGSSLESGWFANTGGGSSALQVAPGTVPTGGPPSFMNPIAEVAPYVGQSSCIGTGYDALDACGDFPGTGTPTTALSPNQLGRLWHPCDAVSAPVPTCVRD